MNQVEVGRARPLSRRATDVPVGQEITRLIVDAEDRVCFVRASNEQRLPASLRWPCVMGKYLPDAIPPHARDGLIEHSAEARRTHRPEVWMFPSTYAPGEWRLLYVVPVKRHPGWLAITCYAVAAEVALPPVVADSGAVP